MNTTPHQSPKSRCSRLTRPRAATLSQEQVAREGALLERLANLEARVAMLEANGTPHFPRYYDPANPEKVWPNPVGPITCGDSPIYLAENTMGYGDKAQSVQ